MEQIILTAVKDGGFAGLCIVLLYLIYNLIKDNNKRQDAINVKSAEREQVYQSIIADNLSVIKTTLSEQSAIQKTQEAIQKAQGERIDDIAEKVNEIKYTLGK